MLIRRPRDIASSQITPRDVYLRRREFLAGSAAIGAASLFGEAAYAAKLEAAKSPLSASRRTQRRSPHTASTSRACAPR